MAQDFLNFWTPMDRNCLRQTDQSKDRMCRAHRFTGSILHLFPSQQAAHISNSLEETFTSHKQRHITTGTDQNVQRKEHIKWAVSKGEQCTLFTFSNFQRSLRFAELFHCFQELFASSLFQCLACKDTEQKALASEYQGGKTSLHYLKEHCTHAILSVYQQQLIFMFTTTDKVYFAWFWKALYAVTGNYFNISICKNAIYSDSWLK